MNYLFAIILPPLGLLMVGKTMHACLCFLLMCTLIGWPVAAFWAVAVVHQHETEARITEAIANGVNKSQGGF